MTSKITGGMIETPQVNSLEVRSQELYENDVRIVESVIDGTTQWTKYSNGRVELEMAFEVTTAIAQAFMGGFRSQGQAFTLPDGLFHPSSLVWGTATVINITAFAVGLLVGPAGGTITFHAPASQTSSLRQANLFIVGRWKE